MATEMGLNYRLRVARRLFALAEEEAAHEAVREDSVRRVLDDRPYCCQTFATGRCPTCIEEAALEAENRWQNGRRDPERWPDDWRERGQEADEAPADPYLAAYLHGGMPTHDDSGYDRCAECGERFTPYDERAEVTTGLAVDEPLPSRVVHVGCMKEGDALA